MRDEVIIKSNASSATLRFFDYDASGKTFSVEYLGNGFSGALRISHDLSHDGPLPGFLAGEYYPRGRRRASPDADWVEDAQNHWSTEDGDLDLTIERDGWGHARIIVMIYDYASRHRLDVDLPVDPIQLDHAARELTEFLK